MFWHTTLNDADALLVSSRSEFEHVFCQYQTPGAIDYLHLIKLCFKKCRKHNFLVELRLLFSIAHLELLFTIIWNSCKKRIRKHVSIFLAIIIKWDALENIPPQSHHAFRNDDRKNSLLNIVNKKANMVVNKLFMGCLFLGGYFPPRGRPSTQPFAFQRSRWSDLPSVELL